MRRRALLGGLGALAVPGAAWAVPCGEDERRRLLKLGDLLVSDAYACGSPVVGPAATSAFLTVDFTSKQNYASTTTQQVVSQRMYGTYMGYGADATNRGGTNTNSFAAYTNSSFTTAMAKANPGLHVVTGNTVSPFWTNDGNGNPTVVNPTAMNNLQNNFYKVDTLGIAGILFGANFNQFAQFSNPAVYAQAQGNMAAYWNNGGAGRLMPNNKPVPFIGCIGHNEPGNPPFPMSTVATYYSALTAAVKAVKSSYVVSGPVLDFYRGGDINTFLADCTTKPDGVSWDAFDNGTGFDPNTGQFLPLTSGMYTTAPYPSQWSGDIADLFANRLPAGYTPTNVLLAGNVGFNGNQPAMWTVDGAMWAAMNQFNNLSTSRCQMWFATWDDGGQTYNGLIADSSNNEVGTGIAITPTAYYFGIGVRNVFGPRWGVPNNSANLKVIATTPAPGRIGVTIINPGLGAKNNQLVALSHWPVNTTGNGTANVWQMTSAVTTTGQDGVSSTIPVVNGVTTTNAAWPSGLSFPDPSITIISI